MITFTLPAQPIKAWSAQDDEFLRENYPCNGQKWCANAMGRSTASIRARTSRLGLKLNTESEFFANFQRRAAQSKVGRKRPEQADVMRRNHAEGKLLLSPESRARQRESLREQIKINGHPRGALGMKHTDETRAALSDISRERFASLSDDQIHERTVKILTTRFARGSFASERKGVSWRGGWRDIGKVQKYYRSRWEANFARYLEWLRVSDYIADWDHEPEVFWFDGIKRGCVSYLPDFRVVEKGGSLTYYEVKGWMDDRSATKIARMAKYHPKIKLIVIRKDVYYAIAKKVSRLCPGWESEAVPPSLQKKVPVSK